MEGTKFGQGIVAHGKQGVMLIFARIGEPSHSIPTHPANQNIHPTYLTMPMLHTT
jgi:hypothetical protein